MIDEAISAAIRQKKLDSLAAKHLHLKRLEWLNRWNQRVDFVALAVPIAYFTLRYLAKGTDYDRTVEIIWELLATALLVLVVLKMAYRWQEKGQRHSELLGENISLVRQANGLLNDSHVSDESVQSFLVLADKSEKDDRSSLGMPSDIDKQFAYREALKESSGTTVVCPVCRSSPWILRPGSCQACGNTPSV